MTQQRTTRRRLRRARLRPLFFAGVATPLLLLLHLLLPPIRPSTLVVADSTSSEPKKRTKKKKILSFGGNGMIGSEVLRRLLSSAEDEYDVTMISRGSWNFDSHETIEPYVKHVVCDRSGGDDDDANSLTLCPEFMEEIALPSSSSDDSKEGDDENDDDGGPYHAVLDFSGYHPKWISDAIELLRSKTTSRGARVYVYVSTDSVYEVSRRQDDPGEGGGGAEGTIVVVKSKEIDAVRPDDLSERRVLNYMDSYGDRKLQGEEVLAAQRHGGEGVRDVVPYVSLRFADVIGPRDGTDRYITYHVWTKFLNVVEGLPSLHLLQDVLETSSVTYVNDAASSIINAMEGGKEIWNEAYNIACEEIFNVTEFLSTLGGTIHNESGRIDPVRKLPRGESFSMYPSIKRGPIDVTKARTKLNFVPTPLRTALEETVRWYEELFKKDSEYRESMLEEFARDVMDEDVMGEERYKEVMTKLWEAAGLDLDWSVYDDSSDKEEEEEYDDDDDDDDEEEDEDWEGDDDEEDDESDIDEYDDGDEDDEEEDESDDEERNEEL